MSIYDNKIVEYWNFLFTDLADPRTNSWPLIGSPIPGLVIIGSYLYFVLSWGPRYMANRKPFKLERTLIIYNFLQVMASIWLFWEGLSGAFLSEKFSFRCQPVDFSATEQGFREARGAYLYMLAKFTELLDTVFFVVRKKERQITFLHLYHHTVMPMISWGATKYFAGGHGLFIGIINSFVHIIMYTYYFFAAMGPQYQKYLWWKKYITNLQMIQFCAAFLHSAQLLYTDCGYPRWSVCFTLPNAIFFYMLFNDFYQRSYKRRMAKQQELVNETSDCLPHELKLLEQAKLKQKQQSGQNGHTNGVKKEMNGNTIQGNVHKNGHANGVTKKDN